MFEVFYYTAFTIFFVIALLSFSNIFKKFGEFIHKKISPIQKRLTIWFENIGNLFIYLSSKEFKIIISVTLIIYSLMLPYIKSI